MVKSIQWTLQLWHAGLMAIVLVGFGTATYFGFSRMRFAQVDADLERAAQVVLTRYRPGGPGGRGGPGPGGPGGGAGRGGGGQDFRREFNRGPGPGGDMIEGPPRGGFGPGPMPPGGEGQGMFGPEGPGRPGGPFGPGGGPGVGPGPGGGPGGFPPMVDWDRMMLPLDMFTGEGEQGMYCVIWGQDGRVVRSTRSAERMADPGPYTGPPTGGPPLGFLRTRGEFREAVRYGPFMSRFVVGKSLAPEYAELRRLAWLLGAAGAGVLLMGLAGGWVLSKRAVRPIGKITQVAKEVSASSLSRRIEVGEIPSEFASLAAVLNETFARLESAFAQQVRFTADASHELRTPLSVIHTHAQLALSRDRSAEEYKKTIATCLRASNRMKGLVDSLLLLASADAGRLRLEPQVFDLRDVVEECVALVAPLGDEKRVEVKLEAGEEEVELEADAARVSQVVINLLSNGIRYNREGGRVVARVGVEGEEAVVTVADTGVGIPAEHQAHMFERFYRVDKARSREVGGSGLGLAICKNIVDAHGGTIGFVSGEGEGTVFTVRLPRKAREGAGPLTNGRLPVAREDGQKLVRE